jgi:dolichyl-phosphate-mannose--protein O-mannosyl transferase
MAEIVYLVLLVFMFIPAYILMQHDDWDDESTTARIQRAAERSWRWLAALLAVSLVLSAVFFSRLSTFSLCFGGAIMALAAWMLWSCRVALRSMPHDEIPK